MKQVVKFHIHDAIDFFVSSLYSIQ